MPVAQPPVVARASVTITWNTPRTASAAVREAKVLAVSGTHVLLRLDDGTTHRYTATPEQARALRARIGSSIAFRVR